MGRVQHFILIILMESSFILPSHTLPSTNDTKERKDNTEKVLSNRKENCEAIPYEQDIVVQGCAVKTIENKFCRGNCISGYVPENGVNGIYKCSSCQPSKTMRKVVDLRCDGGKTKLVEVEIFVSCKCQQSNCRPAPTTKTTKKQKQNESYDPKRPCRYVCRKCRKARRDYEILQSKKEQKEYLVNSCRTVECHKRISQEDVMGMAKVQKKLKKAVCKECRLCKKRKREKANA